MVNLFFFLLRGFFVLLTLLVGWLAHYESLLLKWSSFNYNQSNNQCPIFESTLSFTDLAQMNECASEQTNERAFFFAQFFLWSCFLNCSLKYDVVYHTCSILCFCFRFVLILFLYVVAVVGFFLPYDLAIEIDWSS